MSRLVSTSTCSTDVGEWRSTSEVGVLKCCVPSERLAFSGKIQYPSVLIRAESGLKCETMDDSHSNPDQLNKPADHTSKNLYDVLFGPLTKFFSLLAIVASFYLPVDGLGIDLCWIRKMLSLPCPGCGLTRSVTCISHLNFSDSWVYHPFGFLFYSLFVANLLLQVSPERFKGSLRNSFSRHDRATWIAYKTVISCFVVFGIARMVWCYFDAGQNHV